MTTKAAFWDMLNSHDWHYDRSDDHGVWKRGSEKGRQLGQISRETPAHRVLYMNFYNHIYFNEPKPARPEER